MTRLVRSALTQTRRSILCVALIALFAVFFVTPASAQNACQLDGEDKGALLDDGFECFVFTRWNGPAVPVWLHVPEQVDMQTAPIAVIMHGARRDADRYAKEWAHEAAKRGFIIVAPGFSRGDFPGANGYNLGAMRDAETAQWRDDGLWSFTAIEGIFDAVVARLDGSQSHYTLYGHSAGSQFVHRSLLFKPGPRVKRYLAANAGWYTFPDFERPFPFGLKGTHLAAEDVRLALAKDVVILLGDRDIDPEGRSLNRSKGAMAQGPHRFARGQAFFAAAKQLAHEKGWDFGWSMRVIEGVAHSNAGMATGASDLIE